MYIHATGQKDAMLKGRKNERKEENNEEMAQSVLASMQLFMLNRIKCIIETFAISYFLLVDKRVHEKSTIYTL